MIMLIIKMDQDKILYMKNKNFRNRSKLIMNHGNMAVELSSTKNEATNNGNSQGYPGKSVTETIINGFFTVDRNWTVKYWNQAAETPSNARPRTSTSNVVPWRPPSGKTESNSGSFEDLVSRSSARDSPWNRPRIMTVGRIRSFI